MKTYLALLAVLILSAVAAVTVDAAAPAGTEQRKAMVAVPPAPVACTQEAMQCPDGSYVSRTGPNCEFTPCPSTDKAGTPDTATPDDMDEDDSAGEED